ncbi:hypothetical protein [Flavobacterium sp.]|jgi:hypothetical protein|uniref:hypothetical protein n=1 Tax=Flavobacterium sp. TaxID=239 RepID=UPI0037BF9AD4
MKEIAGIQFNKDASGKEQSVTIDLKKYGNEIQSFLMKIGAIETADAFEKRWSDAISGDELVSRVQTHIKTLPWKR